MCSSHIPKEGGHGKAGTGVNGDGLLVFEMEFSKLQIKFLLFMFGGVIPSNAQGGFLVAYVGIIPGAAWGSSGMPEIEPNQPHARQRIGFTIIVFFCPKSR